MPSTTPQQKVSQVSFFGGNNVTIELVGDTFDASAAAAKAFAKEKGMAFIDPFDDPAIIAGQGTLAVEMMADALAESYQPDYVFAAIGGGGLISGVSTYVKDVSPVTKIIGVEPKGAPSMQEAFDYGAPVALKQLDKFVDGAAVKEVGQLTYQHAKEYVDQLMTVDEGLVCSTILELYSKQAIVAEPAGALSVAALESMQAEIKGKTVICIISGGNNDINRMAEIEERSLIYQGLMNYFVINFPQRPGALKEFVSEVLGPDDDITRFEYTKKINRGSGPVVLGVLSKTREDVPSLFERIAEFDPAYIDLSENQSLFTLLV
jgi:threonine dehydratase